MSFREEGANYISPPNFLKQKVGSGGLPPEIIKKAQTVIDSNEIDFTAYTQRYLDFIETTLKKIVKSDFRTHDHVTTLIYPVMQLKALGGMFGQPLISEIAGNALLFLESVHLLDDDALHVVQAHYDALKPIHNRVYGLGGNAGQVLLEELQSVCDRYYKRYNIEPENR